MVRIIYSIVIVMGLFAGWMDTSAQTQQSQEMSYRVKDEAFNRSRIEDISSFMTDVLGPRLAASKMKLRAERLVMAKLDSLGLKNPRTGLQWIFQKGVGIMNGTMWL